MYGLYFYRTWVSMSKVEPVNLHIHQGPRWRWHCWSRDLPTLVACSRSLSNPSLCSLSKLMSNHFIFSLYLLVMPFSLIPLSEQLSCCLKSSNLLFPHPATFSLTSHFAGLTHSPLLCLSLSTTFQKNLLQCTLKVWSICYIPVLYDINHNGNYIIICEIFLYCLCSFLDSRLHENREDFLFTALILVL